MSQNQKPSTSPTFGPMPAWANVGSDAYGAMNSLLQTAPMAAATQTFAQGGLGPTAQNAMASLMGAGTGAATNPWMANAAQVMQSLAQAGSPGTITPGTIDPGNWQTIFQAAGQPGAAQQYLGSTAQGQYLAGSPYLSDIINRSAQQAADQVNKLFASGGRYGSAAHQGTLADAVAQLSSNLLNQNYQQERDRMLSAAQQIEAAQQGRLGLQGSAAQGIAGIQGQNVANAMNAQQQNIANELASRAGRLGAAQALGGLGQQSFGQQMQALLGAAGLENQAFGNVMSMIGALPAIQQNKIFDAAQQMQVGQRLDQRSQQMLNDLINQWSNLDMQDWARLGGLLAAATGAAGNWGLRTGTSTGSATQMDIGRILGAIGALLL
jgi:hypothetical protein